MDIYGTLKKRKKNSADRLALTPRRAFSSQCRNALVGEYAGFWRAVIQKLRFIG